MIKSIQIHLHVYVKYRAQMLKARMANRHDFFIYIFCDFIIQALGIVFFWSLFSRIPDLKGWRYEQVLLIFGLSQLSYGLFGLLFDGMYNFGNILYTGQFDSVLIRPFHPLFQMAIRGTGDLGGLFTGAGLVAYAAAQGVFHPSFISILVLLLFMGSAALLYLFLYSIIAGMSFFLDNISGTLLSFFGALKQFGEYPLNIYPPVVKVVLTFLIPIGYVGFYPAAYFMEGSFTRYMLLQPLVVTCFGCTALLLWRAGIRRYKSTGN